MKLTMLGSVLPLLCVLSSCGGALKDPPPTPPPSAVHFASVSNADSNTINAYSVDSANGTLQTVNRSPFGDVNGPLALALSPNSDFLAVGNLNGGGIFSKRSSDRGEGLRPATSMKCGVLARP